MIDKPEYELGGYHVYRPDGAKLNNDKKPLPPPEVKYEERKANVDLHVAKTLCGGKYERSEQDRTR